MVVVGVEIVAEVVRNRDSVSNWVTGTMILAVVGMGTKLEAGVEIVVN